MAGWTDRVSTCALTPTHQTEPPNIYALTLTRPKERPHSVSKQAWRHDTILKPHREMDSVMARQQEYWFIARLGDRFELRTTAADDGEVLKAGGCEAWRVTNY